MKRLKLLVVTLLLGVMLVGCSTSELSEVYDEDILKSEAQNIVNLMCNEEYDKISANMGPGLNNVTTKEDLEKQLEEVWAPLKDKIGKFDSIEKEVVMGNEDLATVVEIAKFKNGKVQFTITFNENMELEGIYIK